MAKIEKAEMFSPPEYALPQLYRSPSLCSVDKTIRSNSIHIVSGMRKIQEEQVIGGKEGEKAIKEAQKMTARNNLLRRKSNPVLIDDLRNQPVVLRNNVQRLRKYSCPEIHNSFFISTDNKQKNNSTGYHNFRRSSTGGLLSVDYNEIKCSQLKQPNKLNGTQDKQSVDSRLTESRNKRDKTETLPRIKLDSRAENSATVTSSKKMPGEWSLENEADHGADNLSINSDVFNASNFQEENITVLSYSGEVGKAGGKLSLNPKAARAPSSVVAWLQEINSTLMQ